MSIIVPDLLYLNDSFRPDLAVELDAAGRIARVFDRAELADANDGAPAVVLRDRALLPGFVNAHSHSFQRLIRGRTQWRPVPAGTGQAGRSDFWSWREAMYGAVLRLTPDDVHHAARFCFIEMLRSGITAVGEFHYLHNDESGRPYADRNELALRVIAAAEDVGLRIRLLNVCYATGGIGAALGPDQRRFATPDLDAFLADCAALPNGAAARPLVSMGMAPHSVRAVPRDWLPRLREAAVAHDVPLHMHVSEQPAEIEACVAAYGRRPVELLHDDGLLDDRFTAVHATHIDDAEVRMLAESGATVCACPATERDLGDGMLRAADLLRAGGGIALGTDSQTVIDMFEEARLTEYQERLRRLERVVLTRRVRGDARDGDRLDVAPVLLEMMSGAGARSLRLPAGVIDAGLAADLVAVDLGHPVLAGWTADTLPALLALSATPDVVTDVWVGARRVIEDRAHASQEEAMQEFNDVARRLAAG